MKKESLTLTLLLSFLVTITSFSQVPDYVPTNGLVGWWPFNGNANDESGNGHNGTVNGAVLTTNRFGEFNNAFEFDGVNDFISIPDHNNLDLMNTAFSISVWALIPDYSLIEDENMVGGTDDIRCVLSKPRTSDWTTGYEVRGIDGGLNNNFGYANFNQDNEAIIMSNTPLMLHAWTNIVIVYDGSSLKMYRNGELENSSTTTISQTNSAEPLYFGRAFTNANNNWYRWHKGKIDDVGIWSVALSSQQISDLYNAESFCTETIFITVTDTLIINRNITNISPLTYENSIKIYPNPTSDFMTIDFGNNYSALNGFALKIQNSLGQEMYSTGINTQQTNVTISSWVNGIYFVHLIDDNGEIVDIRKIVLQ